MLGHDYSQLPVIDSQTKRWYLVTSDSILQAFVNFGVIVNKTELRVKDALVKVERVYYASDDLFELLRGVKDTGAALIVNDQQELTHVVTSFDTTEYFRQWAEDIMYARDIESTLKRFINAGFKQHDGDIDELARQALIDELTSSNRQLRRQFERALNRYLKHDAICTAKLDPKSVDVAFAALLKGSCDNQFVPSRDLGAEEQVQIDQSLGTVLGDVNESTLENALASSRNLRQHFEQALCCYIQQQTDNATTLDSASVDDAFQDLVNRKEKPQGFRDLTLDAYIRMFLHEPRWPLYHEVFQLDRSELDNILSGVRDTRNKLSHFREDEITASQRAQLRSCAAWLDRHRKLVDEVFDARSEQAHIATDPTNSSEGESATAKGID